MMIRVSPACKSFSNPRVYPQPYTGLHYSIDQPGEGPVNPDMYSSGRISPDDVAVRKSINIAYLDLGAEIYNPRDSWLFDDRLVSTEPHPERGRIITTEIRHGDCFNLDSKFGVWKFVGVRADNPQYMVFVPADSETHIRRTPTRGPTFKTLTRGDFGFKFAGLPRDREHQRLSPEKADHPSEHAFPESPDAVQMGAISRLLQRINDALSRTSGH